MSEGVDLKGDHSRFQIICKVPYPYLGDNIVRKRMAKNKKWYPMKTAISIVQSCGRSIRSISDTAVTYILDSDWKYFYRKNKDVFPAIETSRVMFKPLFLTTIILGFGFGVLGFANLVILQKFGIFTMIAIFLAFISDIVVLPAMIRYFGLTDQKKLN